MDRLRSSTPSFPALVSWGDRGIEFQRNKAISYQKCDRIMKNPEYYKLRNYALDFLYNRFAHDDAA